MSIAIAVGAAWLYLGPDTAHLWLDGLIADLLATLVIFVFSRIHHNSSFYDAYWSVLPPLLAIYWWSESTPGRQRRTGLAGRRCDPGVGDPAHRQLDLRVPGVPPRGLALPAAARGQGQAPEPLVDLFGIHLVPTLQVFLGMVPVYVAVSRTGRDVGWLDIVAVAVGLGAVALEFTADLQMYRFARTKQPGQAMDQGLWGWSRHPNYFGEIGFWLSLGLFGLATSPSDWWFVFVGAIAMVALFLGASIPMMEQRSLERRPRYQDVIDRVPKLVPRPPRSAT